MLATAATATALGVAFSEAAYKIERNLAPLISKDGGIDNCATVLPHEVFTSSSSSSSNNKTVLVFLHGWPDDLLLLRPYAEQLSQNENGDYLCVNITLPGYPLPSSFTGHAGTVPPRRWGFGLDETVLAIHSTIQFALKQHGQDNDNGNSGVTLVVHDWGSVLGHMLAQQQQLTTKVSRIVCMDVGGRPAGWTPPFLFLCMLYQLIACFAFMLPQVLGDLLTQIELLVFLRPAYGGPDRAPITAAKNWPYRAAWREWFTHTNQSKQINIRQGFYYTPQPDVPYLFLYSEFFPEPVRFYDGAFASAVIASSPKSRAVPVEGNHWFMITAQEETLGLITQWLEDTE